MTTPNAAAQNEATVTRMARAKALAKRSGKVVGYTAGAAIVAGLGYLAYGMLKGTGASVVAEAVAGTVATATDAAVETVAAALRG